jgi:hypothetical protein
MVRNLPDKEWINIVTSALTGTNHCHFKHFSMDIPATRMSGEMCTSLGNGFSNLMLFLFVAKKMKLTGVKGFVEGDDGIFSYYGPELQPQPFAELGFNIKIVNYDKITEGSFCGILADEDDLICVTDPIDALCNFGWTTRQYAYSKVKKMKMLLRSKALSMVYQYHGCPILQSLAQYGIRLTQGTRFKLNSRMSAYDKEKFSLLYQKYKDKIPDEPVPWKTRLLVEKYFKIVPTDQIMLEKYLDSLNSWERIDHPVIRQHMPKPYKDYIDKYMVLCMERFPVPSFGSNYDRAKYVNYIEKCKIKEVKKTQRDC